MPRRRSAKCDQRDGVGPWVSAAGHTHHDHSALGDQAVNNYGYSGPSVTTPPFNQQKVTRHYGFGHYCRERWPWSAAMAWPRPLTGVSWSDTSHHRHRAHRRAELRVQQQAQYGGSTAQCGELVITAANGKQSIDTVTVTVGGKAPTAAAGWPDDSVRDRRCQAGRPDHRSSGHLQRNVADVEAGPAARCRRGVQRHRRQHASCGRGKFDPWRRQVVCLFGLALNGTPDQQHSNPYDPPILHAVRNVHYPTCKFAGGSLAPRSHVGWDATLNGNLAEQLHEPTLMGAYEGAGITVLARA